jgi:hypothetical protein
MLYIKIAIDYLTNLHKYNTLSLRVCPLGLEIGVVLHRRALPDSIIYKAFGLKHPSKVS